MISFFAGVEVCRPQAYRRRAPFASRDGDTDTSDISSIGTRLSLYPKPQSIRNWNMRDLHR